MTDLVAIGGRGDALPAPIAQLEAAAQMLAQSGAAVPPAFRGQPDLCKAIAWQAAEWGMSPLAVAQKAYVVPGRKAGEERVAYEAQLIHALVNERAPLVGRLRFEFEGDGGQRRVVVSGLLRGEEKPAVYRSPSFAQIKTKNSPLWFSDLDQQFRYYGARNWARAFCPEVILGIEAPDEREVVDLGDAPTIGAARTAALFDDSDAATDAEFTDAPPTPLTPLEERAEAAISRIGSLPRAKLEATATDASFADLLNELAAQERWDVRDRIEAALRDREAQLDAEAGS